MKGVSVEVVLEELPADVPDDGVGEWAASKVGPVTLKAWAAAYAQDVFNQRARAVRARAVQAQLSRAKLLRTTTLPQGHTEWSPAANARHLRRVEERRKRLIVETDAQRQADYQRAQDSFTLWMEPYLTALQFTEAFMAQEFVLPNGRRVTWGSATAKQHQECVKMLRRNQQGLQRDVDLHLSALVAIESTSARCLSDVRRSDAAAVGA